MIWRVWRRLRQGIRAIFAFTRRVDDRAAAAVLSPELMDLFRRMRRSEQLHSLCVMRWLTKRGHTHPDLLTAALLHDSGKSRCPFSITDRAIVVLANALMPRRVARWGSEGKRGWRRAFVVKVYHPDWAAEDMLAAGASPLAVALVCRHQEKAEGEPQTEEDRLLRLLQQADDAC
jgi:hypothetical protein